MQGITLPQNVRDALACGDAVYDHEFDGIFPKRMQSISESQWSPVKVGHIVRRLVCENAQDPSLGEAPLKFIDLGCGVGKLCLYLALATDLEVYGVERRRSLVAIAESLCEANAPGKVHFTCGDILDVDWTAYDVFYLYNPFMEHKCSIMSTNLIDRNIEFGERAYRRYVDGVSKNISELRDDQRVITFHGFGGQMPPDFECSSVTKIGNGSVRLWQRRSVREPVQQLLDESAVQAFSFKLV